MSWLTDISLVSGVEYHKWEQKSVKRESDPVIDVEYRVWKQNLVERGKCVKYGMVDMVPAGKIPVVEAGDTRLNLGSKLGT